jgi:hypothetical protein
MWESDKKSIRDGYRDPFDVDVWETQQDEIAVAKQRRHEKRCAKRKLRGLSIEPPTAVSEAEADTDDEEDVPLATSARPRAQRGSVSALTEPVVFGDETHGGNIARPMSHTPRANPTETMHQLLPTASAAQAAVINNAVSTNTFNKARSTSSNPQTISSITVKPVSSKKSVASSNVTELIPLNPIQPSTKPIKTSLLPRTIATSAMKKSAVALAQNDNIKSMSDTGKKTTSKTGAELLEGWANPPPSKRPRTQNPDQAPRLYNFSAKHNAEMAGRNGAAPNPDEILLATPNNIHKLDSGNTAATGLPENHALESVVTIPQTSTVQRKPEEQNSSRIDMSCWAWINGSCSLGADRCAFLHRDADEESSQELYVQFMKHYSRTMEMDKFTDDPNRLCLYWARKDGRGCTKSTVDCKYAHWYWTGFHPKEPPPRPTGKKRKTCFFLWQYGACSRGDQACEYSHEYLPGSVAHPPNSRVHGPINDSPHGKMRFLIATAAHI